MVAMDHSADTDLPEPDLAQLLVLEAGRILEDLTPELVMKLPQAALDRSNQLTAIVTELERAGAFLKAARAFVSTTSTG